MNGNNRKSSCDVHIRIYLGNKIFIVRKTFSFFLQREPANRSEIIAIVYMQICLYWIKLILIFTASFFEQNACIHWKFIYALLFIRLSYWYALFTAALERVCVRRNEQCSHPRRETKTSESFSLARFRALSLRRRFTDWEQKKKI